ncbi:hypothetical protein TNCV_2556821 [Trichonephila clavipes]|nr:hypothetical protein TNCV_2556821 [Trichonephila clavipes]
MPSQPSCTKVCNDRTPNRSPLEMKKIIIMEYFKFRRATVANSCRRCRVTYSTPSATEIWQRRGVDAR